MRHRPGEAEMHILCDLFDWEPLVIEEKLLHFMLWGKPDKGEDRALYYAYKAMSLIGFTHDYPTSENAKKVFIASLLDIEIGEIKSGLQQPLAKILNEVITRYMISKLLEPNPDESPRFNSGDWAWHENDERPVLVLVWDSNFCKILVPHRNKKRQYCVEVGMLDGPSFSSPKGADATAVMACEVREYDHEPAFIVPLGPHLTPVIEAEEKTELPY